MSKFSKEHYEDVARVLSYHTTAAGMDNERERMQWLTWIAKSFIDLFAKDNPPSTHCWHCGSNRNVVTDCTHVEHNYGGFNREQFLAVCGLEPQH